MSDDTSELFELQKQIQEQTKKLAATEAKAAAQERKRQEEEDRTYLSETLSSMGVKEVQLRMALNHLRAEGLVKRADSGELVFVKQRAGGREEELGLAEGIAGFLKSADGKFFVHRSGAEGSGGTGRRQARDRGGENRKTAKEIAAESLTAFRRRGSIG